MLPRGRGTMLFTGATASLRGGAGFAAFAAAKAGCVPSRKASRANSGHRASCALPSNVGEERAVADLVLWGATTSRTIRAHWALHELGLSYRCEPIRPRTGETRTERFTAIAPRQKIPALVDGDFVVAESAAIVAYLSAVYGTPSTALVPTGARERARYDEWTYFVMTELDATSL